MLRARGAGPRVPRGSVCDEAFAGEHRRLKPTIAAPTRLLRDNEFPKYDGQAKPRIERALDEVEGK